MKRQNVRKLTLLISFLIFPITLYYMSPYLIIMGGITGLVSGSFIVFIVQFITSLFFGRAFCAWICPAGGLQECCTMAVNKKVSKKARYIKYVIWVPWLITIVLLFIKAGGIKSIDFFLFTKYGISVTDMGGIIMYFAIITLFVILALTVGRRGMCHTICWMSPFMILGTKIKNALHIPSFHLKAEPTKCIDCGKCTKNCPMSLEVNEMVRSDKMNHSECILCLECVDNCPKKAIHFKVGVPYTKE